MDPGNLLRLVSQHQAMVPDKPSQGGLSPTPVTCESGVPNPKLKLLDQIPEVMRLQLVEGRELRERAAAG